MLVERKILEVMIYNQLVEMHNFLCESEEYGDRTEVAPEGFYDMTKVSSDDKKISKIDALGVVKSLEDHLAKEYQTVPPERKAYLRDNLDTIDMIFDPITPEERAFIVNEKAKILMQRLAEKEALKREEALGINKDVDDIIGDVDSTFPPMGRSELEDTIKLSRSAGGIEDTLPTGVAVNYDPNADYDDTFELPSKDDTKDLNEKFMSRGSLLRKRYYGRY